MFHGYVNIYQRLILVKTIFLGPFKRHRPRLRAPPAGLAGWLGPPGCPDAPPPGLGENLRKVVTKDGGSMGRFSLGYITKNQISIHTLSLSLSIYI